MLRRRPLPLRASASSNWCIPLLALVCAAWSQAAVAQNTPSKPATPSVTPGHSNVIVSSSVSSNGGSAVTKWQYKKKEGSNAWDTDWTDVSNSADNSMTVTVVALTNGTTYKFKVRAMNSNGWSEESDESDEATPTPTTLSVQDRTETSATISLAGYPGNWYYKGGKDGSGNCTLVSAGTTTVALGSLTEGTSYTYNAYNATNANCESDQQIGSALTFSTLDFRLSSKTDTTANLELDHWSQGDAWSYRKEHPGTGTCTNTTTTSVGLTGLEENTSYTYRAYRGSDCATGQRIAVVYFKTTPAHGLFASEVRATTAKLRLDTAGAAVAWSHKKTVGPGSAPCANVTVGTDTVDLSGLTADQSYTWAAYREGNCVASKKIDDVRFATKKPMKPAKPTVAAGNARVKLTSSVQTNGGPAITKWQYIKKEGSKAWETNWKDISNSADTTLSTTITGLTNNTQYRFKVRAVNSVDDGVESDQSDAVTPMAVALAASSVTHNSATLTLSGHPGNWWLKRSTPADTTCKSKGTTATESLSSLDGNTSYTYKAYSNSGCTTELASETFLTKPAKPGKPTATPGAGSGKLILTATLSGGTGALTKWEYTKDNGTNWTSITTDTDNNLSHLVTGLNNNNSYSFKVRATNAAGTGPVSEASTGVNPLDETLTASSVQHDSATLTIGNYPASDGWYYKHTTPSNGTCSNDAVATSSVDVDDLAGNTSYVFKAYSDSGCNTELAAASSFLTRPAKPAKPTVTAGSGSGKLTVASSVTGGSAALTRWEYTTDDGAKWTNISDTDNSLSAEISGLDDDTDYTFKVRARNATGAGPASDASEATAPVDETLASSSVTHNSATLTIGNYPVGDGWYYKHTTPSNGSCVGTAVNTAETTVSSLKGNTSYVFKAYSDSGCNTELAAASSFLTKPAKPGKPSAAAGAGSGKLTLTATLSGGSGALTKWEYTKDDGANWTDITDDTDNNLSHVVSGLSNTTSYTFKVRATNTTGIGPISDASTATKPQDETLTASSVEHGSATLTIGNYTPDWYYKHTTPSNGTCSTNAVSGMSSTVSSLNGNTSYVFKAYSDGSCNNELAEASSFLTKPAKPSKPAVTAGVGSGKLKLTATLTGGSGALSRWEYTKDNGSNWSNITTETDNSLSHVVGSLTNGTSYTFKVRARNATGHGPASDASDSATPVAPTLAASDVEDDTATLTLSNWSGAWRYKRTTPANGSCSSEIAAGTTKADLTGLSTGTSHIYKAYSNSNCTGTAIATASAFTTKPGKVSNVALAAQNEGLKVTWSAETGASSYKVQWKHEDDSDWDATNRQTTSTSTSKTLSSLENGDEYTIRVGATNATGDGEWSDEATGTPSTKPPAPNKPTVAARHEAVILGWSGNGDGGSAITKWKYAYKTTGSYGSWTEVPNSGADTTSYTVPSLTNGTAYKFKVRAVNANGDGAESAESDAATPGSVTLSVKNVTATKVTLEINGHNTTWSYKGQQAGATCSGSIATSSKEVTTLTKATAYIYDAYATTDCTGDVLARVSFTTTDVPGKPTNVTVAKGNAKVTLRWTSGSNGGSPITKWQFKKHDGSAWDTGWTDICTTQNDTNCPSKTRHEVSNLTNGTAYKFKVQAVNVNGGTESSESAAVTPSTKPGKPTNLTVTKGNKQVTLGWTSGGDGGAAITEWEYRRKTGTSWGSWTDICTSSGNAQCAGTTSHTFTGLTNGTTYRFKVRAKNGDGFGPGSDESAEVTPSTTPPAPTGLTATKGYKSVSLSWSTGGNGGSAITGWKYLQHENGSWSAAQPMTGSGKNTRSHVVGSLSNNTAYKFKVLAVNANGDGAESAESNEATPSNPEVSARNVTATSATITLSGYSGSWSYKPQSGGSCDDVTSGNSVRVTGLDSATTYNYSIFVGTDCTGDSLGGVQFTTKDTSSTRNDGSDNDDRSGDAVTFTPGLRAVPLFLSASDPLRESFVRVINQGGPDTARITAFDDTGQRYGPVTLSLRAGGARHFNSTDLELGNPDKGLPEGIGGGMGDWRLLFDSDQPLEVLAYVRGRDGFVTAMHEVAEAEDDAHSIHFLNPASNWRQVSRLRLINWETSPTVVDIRGWDDAGVAGDAAVVLALNPREARTLTSEELEAAGLGDGEGKWRLEVQPRAEGRITAMSLLESPTGHLSNLSAANGTTVLPLFLSAADAPDRQGFARIINRATDPVTARLTASDGSAWTYEPVSLRLAGLGAAQFNSHDLEQGNPDKGLSGGVGAGQGHWRVRVTGGIGLLPLAYSRASDGFVTGLNGPAPVTVEASGESHRVAFFNPGSNWRQVSLLWLANPGEATADVRIAATDDLGRQHGSAVTLRLPPGSVRMLRSADLEVGGEGFNGAFGDGTGKWRLDVRSNQPITVMSLLESPTLYRHLSNLSTVPSDALILPTRYATPN